MKALLCLLLGIVIGAVGYHWVAQRSVTPVEKAGSDSHPEGALDRARAGAREMGDRIARQLEEWDLDPEEIKRELAQSGRVIRNKARVAGVRIDDARIVAMIKAKYVLDDGLAAAQINVDCRDGHVRLDGQVPSDAAVGRAVALALETSGVVEVNAELTPGA